LGDELSDIRRKPSSFEEYWLASKAWQRKGLPLASARALANAGFLTVDDLQSANSLELEMIPRIGAKSLALLYELKGERCLTLRCCAARPSTSIVGLGIDGPAANSGALLQPLLRFAGSLDWVWDGTANPYRSYSAYEQLAKKNPADVDGATGY